jgi:hypothetical protein
MKSPHKFTSLKFLLRAIPVQPTKQGRRYNVPLMKSNTDSIIPRSYHDSKALSDKHDSKSS